MFKSFEELRSAPPTHFPYDITFVSAPCGSGKTHVACQFIKDIGRIEGNVLFVLPTKILIDEVQNRLNLGPRRTEWVRSGLLSGRRAA